MKHNPRELAMCIRHLCAWGFTLAAGLFPQLNAVSAERYFVPYTVNAESTYSAAAVMDVDRDAGVPILVADVDADGDVKVMDEVKKVYVLDGAADRLTVTYPNCEHSFPDDARDQAYE